jgi:hypothetical protein
VLKLFLLFVSYCAHKCAKYNVRYKPREQQNLDFMFTEPILFKNCVKHWSLNPICHFKKELIKNLLLCFGTVISDCMKLGRTFFSFSLLAFLVGYWARFVQAHVHYSRLWVAHYFSTVSKSYLKYLKNVSLGLNKKSYPQIKSK